MTSYLVFHVGDQRVGIDMIHILETMDPIEVRPLPLSPAFHHGLFNLRGLIVPLLDLGPFVGALAAASLDRPQMVVVEKGGFRFAALTHRVDTASVDETQFQPHPQSGRFPALDAEVEYTRGQFTALHLDRLEVTLKQALDFEKLT